MKQRPQGKKPLSVIINIDSTDEEVINIRMQHVTKLYYTLSNTFIGKGEIYQKTVCRPKEINPGSLAIPNLRKLKRINRVRDSTTREKLEIKSLLEKLDI